MSVTTERGRTHTAGLRDRLGTRLADAKTAVTHEAAVQALRVAGADGFGDYLEGQLEDARELHAARHPEPAEGLVARAGQNVDLVGLAIALVVVGVVMYVGLNVMSTTEQSAGLDTSADPGNRTQFENASADLTGGISDAYSLSGILFLVLILTGVVGLLLGLRGRRG